MPRQARLLRSFNVMYEKGWPTGLLLSATPHLSGTVGNLALTETIATSTALFYKPKPTPAAPPYNVLQVLVNLVVLTAFLGLSSLHFPPGHPSQSAGLSCFDLLTKQPDRSANVTGEGNGMSGKQLNGLVTPSSSGLPSARAG